MVTHARSRWAPERGDLIWLEFAPTRGHEQDGCRPAVVISPRAYNEVAALAFVVPVTSRSKGYSFEVLVAVGDISGVALADHARSVAWRERNARLIGRVSSAAMEEIEAKLARLIHNG